VASNLTQLILEVAQARPELRIRDVDADETITLRELVGCAAGWAMQAKRSGLRAGARVALVQENSLRLLIEWAGCQFAGLETALVNPAFPADLLQQLLAVLSPVAVSSTANLGEWTSAPQLGAVVGVDVAALREQSRRARGYFLEPLPGSRRRSTATAGYMLTSGSEGIPKFCAQSHNYFLQLGQLFARQLLLTPHDRVFTPLPLFHINPLGYALLGGICAGADVIFAQRFSASNFWQQVSAEEVTALVLHTGPVQILKSRDPHEQEPHRVRIAFLADHEFLERFGIDVGVAAYGSTEAGGISHIRTWQRREAPAPETTPGRYVAGVPRPDLECRVAENGEILLRELTPGSLFSGYLSPHGGLDRCRDGDGWFHTGDLGEDGADGRLAFLGRAKEALRIRGEFVPIAYLEQRFSSLLEGTPVAVWYPSGDDPKIALYVEGQLDESALARIRGAATQLPRFMRPDLVALVESLPRDSGVGKVLHRHLSTMQAESWVPL